MTGAGAQRTAEDAELEGLSEADRKKLKSKQAKAERKKAEEALKAEEVPPPPTWERRPPWENRGFCGRGGVPFGRERGSRMEVRKPRMG